MVLALKTSSDAIKELIFSSMSTRAAEMVRDDLENLGPVKVSDVETAVSTSETFTGPRFSKSSRTISAARVDILLKISSLIASLDVFNASTISADMVLALKTSSDAIKELIFSSMSTRAAEMVRDDLENLGPVKVSDVETAQQKIIKVVKKLEEDGTIVIAGAGGGDVV